MKKVSGFLSILAFLIVVNFGLRGSSSQEIKSKEQQIAQWEKDVPKYRPSKNSSEIEPVYSFPAADLQEKNIYLWNARNIENDHSGNFYAIDTKWKSIFKFDSKGAFLKKTGRNGQGPGEFMNPFCLCVSNANVFVSDTNKYEIQVFDLELNYQRTLKLRKSYLDLAVNQDGTIFGAPFRMTPDSPLVDVISGEGRILFSFGKPMFGSEQNWTVPNFIRIGVNENREVFVAYQHFSTVCKYDKSGQLVSVYQINNRLMKERERWNIKSIQDNSHIYYSVIDQIRVGKQGFFIMQNAPFTQILEFDEKGENKRGYWFVRSYDYAAADFLVEDNVERKIIVLQNSPQNLIEVFRIKNKNR